MFTEFEKIIHEEAKSSIDCRATVLIYRDLNIRYYGPDIVMDDYIDMEWARIPHLPSFYV